MNYIGSKYSIIDFLNDSVNKTLVANNETRQPQEMVFNKSYDVSLSQSNNKITTKNNQ